MSDTATTPQPNTPNPVETLLFAQHGWADTNRAMQRFGERVAPPASLVIAPNLGYMRTWLRIEPLIAAAERAAASALEQHPDARLHAVGHSMGGLIWIELLARHPDWLARTDRLVLVGCPVGGAGLARFVDPLGLTIGRDLLVDRRTLAETVAAAVPTLSIVGDLLGPHDGTVSHESARLEHARFVLAPASSHAGLRRSRWVTLLTRAFLRQPLPAPLDLAGLATRLQTIPGIRPGEPRLFRLARVAAMFADGSTIRLFDVVPGVELVFVANGEGYCVYAGAVAWRHRRTLRQALHEIEQRFRPLLLHPPPDDEP